MKTLHRFIFAVMSVSIALSSCTKENISGRDGSDSAILAGERLLKVSFEPGTKTELNTTGGVLSPEFVAGDKIRVSNGTAYEDCTVRIDEKGVFFIRTALTGVLDAVYPETAAAMSGNAITGIQVSSSQSGLFKDANICMAEDVAADATAMHFSNRTTILQFYVDASIDVKSITITSGGGDIATGSTPKNVTVSATGGASLHTIAEDDKHRLCYASILPDVSANALTFKSVTNSQGTVERTMQSSATLAVNRIYKAFIPYYIKIGTQRWGYCNVGAFLPEDYGLYFGWGDLVGQTWNGSAWSAGGFGWSRDPANGGNTTYNADAFNANKDTVCPGNVLALAYDTANKFWGNGWHMPTGGNDATSSDFKVLVDNTSHSAVTVDSVKGCKFTDINNSNIYVFFPLAGLSEDGFDIKYVGSNANYWSSTLYPSNLQCAWWLQLSNGNPNASSYVNRFRGGSIRPIYKTSVSPLDIGGYGEPENIE